MLDHVVALPAPISAARVAGMSAVLMWSTVASTPLAVAPLLDELVEPDIVAGDEVGPLEEAELGAADVLGGGDEAEGGAAAGARVAAAEGGGGEDGGGGAGHRALDEAAAGGGAVDQSAQIGLAHHRAPLLVIVGGRRRRLPARGNKAPGAGSVKRRVAGGVEQAG